VVRSRFGNVRFGSKADIGARPHHVRFAPKSGHWLSALVCPLCAKSRHSAVQRSMPDLVVAFPGGGGTKDMVKRAVKARVPVHEVNRADDW
jgi:hypothetical protein